VELNQRYNVFLVRLIGYCWFIGYVRHKLVRNVFLD